MEPMVWIYERPGCRLTPLLVSVTWDIWLMIYMIDLA